MQQGDQTVVHVLTPSDFQSDDKTTQNQKDEVNRNSICHGEENKSNKNGSKEPEKETFFKKFGGMLMALSASFFFSVSFLIIKILGNHGFKAFGCSVLFNLGVLIPCFIGILLHEIGPKAQDRTSLFKEIWPLSIARKNVTLKILLVSVCLAACISLTKKYFFLHFFFYLFIASRYTARIISRFT